MKLLALITAACLVATISPATASQKADSTKVLKDSQQENISDLQEKSESAAPHAPLPNKSNKIRRVQAAVAVFLLASIAVYFLYRFNPLTKKMTKVRPKSVNLLEALSTVERLRN